MSSWWKQRQLYISLWLNVNITTNLIRNPMKLRWLDTSRIVNILVNNLIQMYFEDSAITFRIIPACHLFFSSDSASFNYHSFNMFLAPVFKVFTCQCIKPQGIPAVLMLLNKHVWLIYYTSRMFNNTSQGTNNFWCNAIF